MVDFFFIISLRYFCRSMKKNLKIFRSSENEQNRFEIEAYIHKTGTILQKMCKFHGKCNFTLLQINIIKFSYLQFFLEYTSIAILF